MLIASNRAHSVGTVGTYSNRHQLYPFRFCMVFVTFPLQANPRVVP